MKLFDVYPLYDVCPVKAKGSYVWDDKGQKYLDLYGGHAVISIGHSHPVYAERLKNQIDKIGFYSNAVHNPLQKELASKLGTVSQCDDYQLFLCNSGAEANENALKIASFHTQKSRVIAFKGAFHGRTSAAVSITDNAKIIAPINAHNPITLLPLNDLDALEASLSKGDVCAVIIEGIQGVGGLDQGSESFIKALPDMCKKYGALLILDEIQSGFGRTGTFFSFQHHGIEPDIISMAKGMGNGFPVGGVLIHNNFKPSYGMLGTTFGGNHLACAATLAVLEVLEEERILEHVQAVSQVFVEKVKNNPHVKNIKGKGLMLGLELNEAAGPIRKRLIYEKQIFTGGAMNPNLVRILPALNVKEEEVLSLDKALLELLD